MGKITDINDLMRKFNDRHKDTPDGGGTPPTAPPPTPPAVDGSSPEGTPEELGIDINDVHVAIVVSMDADGVNVLPMKPNMNLELMEAALSVAVRRVQSARLRNDVAMAYMATRGQMPSGLVVPPPQ